MPQYTQQYDGGRVDFDLSPGFSTPVAPGETITITGTARCDEFDVTALCVTLCKERSSLLYPTSLIGPSRRLFPVNWTKGTANSFRAEYTVSAETLAALSGSRLKRAYLAFSFIDASGGGAFTQIPDGHRLTLLAYRIEPRILKADFHRCGEKNGSYTPADDGLYCVCGGLKIALDDGRDVSDITIARVIMDETTLSIPESILEAALDGGYSETAPALLAGLTFPPETAHSLRLEIGDQYDLAVADVSLNRAFANFCLAGYETGGVAMGGFPLSQPGKPRFDCFYPAHFMAGLTASIPGVNSYAQAETPTGGTWLDGRAIYRMVIPFSSAGKADITAATLPEFSTIVRVEGMAVWHTGHIFPLGYYADATNYTFCYIDDQRGVIIHLPFQTTGFVCVEYTKP